MAIAVLEESEITELIRKAVALATTDLRDELERSRTPELMTKDRLAIYLECHVSSINRFMKNGLPFEMLGDHPRFRKVDIDNWLKHGSVQTLQRETNNGEGSELPEGSLVGAQMHPRPDHSPLDSRSAD